MCKYDIGFHLHADVHNMYEALQPLDIFPDISSAFITMAFIKSDVGDWMIVNMLGINDTKPDFSVLCVHIDNALTMKTRSMRYLESAL